MNQKLDEIISLLKEIKQLLGGEDKPWEKNGYIGDIPINTTSASVDSLCGVGHYITDNIGIKK